MHVEVESQVRVSEFHRLPVEHTQPDTVATPVAPVTVEQSKH